MKNEDLNPETQEKLLQLQKYQEQQLQNPIPHTSVVSNVKGSFDNNSSSLQTEPSRVKTEVDDIG